MDAITTESLSASRSLLGNGVLDMSCPSSCISLGGLFPCPLATLVQFARGDFPFLQVNTFGIVLGLLNGALAIVSWSSISVSQLEVMSCLIGFFLP